MRNICGTLKSMKKLQLKLILIVIYLWQLPNTQCQYENYKYCSNETDIIDHLLMDTAQHYNRHQIPSYPVTVKIELWIQEVTSVSEMTEDFEIDLYVNEYWEDPALQYDYMRPCKRNLTFDYNMWDEIWIPNTCFINTKSAEIHSSPFRNVFLMVFPNGSLWSNWRIKSRGPCEVDLRHFPLDSISCYLTFESYNYNQREVHMIWHPEVPVSLSKNITLPDFDLVHFNHVAITKEYAAGNWDELTVSFMFRRRYGWYLLQGYIPTYMTVFISWIPFYLGPKAIPARTMIGVNALLAITFQFGNVIRNLPRVNYVKAIDVWMLSGIGFVFASLVELAIVGYVTRNDEKATYKISNGTKKRRKKLSNKINCEQLDLLSRILFPGVFTFFNLIYWGVYMKGLRNNF